MKTQSNPELARRTAAAICRRYACSPQRQRLEVISFHTSACEVAAAAGFRTRLVIWADYAPEVLAGWALRHGVSGVKVEHFLLSDELVGRLRAAGITVSTGTVNDVELLEKVLHAEPRCITTDRPHELRDDAIARGLLPVATGSRRPPERSGGRLGLRSLDQLVNTAELYPRAAVRLARLDLGGVDRLPALEGDVVGPALVEQRPRSSPGRRPARPRGSVPASRSAKRLSTVSWASFLLVPITPEGPRLIQPTA